jgi:hypothetical protein
MKSLLLMVLLSGCVVAQLSESAKSVRTVKGDVPMSCTEIGTVDGVDSRLNSYSASTKFSGDRDQAYIRLRNNAAEKGGNFVRIDAEGQEESSDNVGITLKYVIRGVAFRCPSQTADATGGGIPSHN